jgi:hypothetical protein
MPGHATDAANQRDEIAPFYKLHPLPTDHDRIAEHRIGDSQG